MSYFSATMKVNQEGDVLISDDTIQGLGTTQRFLRFFFGSLFIVAHTLPYNPLPEASAPLGGMASTPSTMVYQGAGALPPRSEADKSSASSSIEEIPAQRLVHGSQGV